MRNLIQSILYHIDCIDTDGFSNQRIVTEIKRICNEKFPMIINDIFYTRKNNSIIVMITNIYNESLSIATVNISNESEEALQQLACDVAHEQGYVITSEAEPERFSYLVATLNEYNKPTESLDYFVLIEDAIDCAKNNTNAGVFLETFNPHTYAYTHKILWHPVMLQIGE